jgi:hypothetical protein
VEAEEESFLAISRGLSDGWGDEADKKWREAEAALVVGNVCWVGNLGWKRQTRLSIQARGFVNGRVLKYCQLP